jgi:hypothetical protein
MKNLRQAREALEPLELALVAAVDGTALPAPCRPVVLDLLRTIRAVVKSTRSPQGGARARLACQSALALLADPGMPESIGEPAELAVKGALARLPVVQGPAPRRRKRARKGRVTVQEPIRRPTPARTRPRKERPLEATEARPGDMPPPSSGFSVEVRFIHRDGAWKAEVPACHLLALLGVAHG